MDVESQPQQQQQPPPNKHTKPTKRKLPLLLILNLTLLVLGASITPLLLRLYFIHHGSRKWLSSWLQTAGFPFLLLPLSLTYKNRRKLTNPNPTPLLTITYPLFIASSAIGILIGLDDFLYAYGTSDLPVSTSALLISTQLGFTALSAFFLVKQKFSPYSINAIALLSFGAVVLGIHSSGDRPKGETTGMYYVGFAMMMGAAALYGLILPLVEVAYKKAKNGVTYELVMEMQFVMGLFATLFCTVGMLVNGDFQVMQREAKEFKSGETSYYMVIVWSAIFSQFFYLGVVGVIQCGSALLAGIIIAVLIPVTEILAVIFFHESFNGGKGVALALSLWGFVSYFYGEYKASKKEQEKKRKSIAAATNPL